MNQDHLFAAWFIYAPAWAGVDADPQTEAPETVEEDEEDEEA
ncbi:MAG: hypothetical protein ACOCXM_02040 [Myxococcota bacterium]